MNANIPVLVYFERWLDSVAETMLEPSSDVDLVRLEYASPQADNYAEMARAHGYQISPRTEIQEPWLGDADLLAKCPNLLAISSAGAGYDVVNVSDCTKAGVILVNQSGTNKEGVAEHAMGLMLALCKKIMSADRDMRRVKNIQRFSYTGSEMLGKTLGIIGLGQIGTRTVELCKHIFNMRVIAYDPYLTAEQIAERGGEKVEMDELFAKSDFISVHCPRTDESFGMIGKTQFDLMKPTAFFVTTARGGVHKEDDLVQALKDGKLAGAGIDVFLEEPPPLDHPLFEFDNVIATPHMAGITAESLRAATVAAVEQWLVIFSGGVPPRLINPEVWSLYCERFEKIFGRRPAALPKAA